MSYLSTTEKAKIIRNELKAIGITSKHISVVKDSWGSIRLTLKVEESDLDMKAVSAIAYKHESIDRCEVSGEILMGCNTFISIVNLQGYSKSYR